MGSGKDQPRTNASSDLLRSIDTNNRIGETEAHKEIERISKTTLPTGAELAKFLKSKNTDG